MKHLIEKHAIHGLYQNGNRVTNSDEIKKNLKILNLGCGNNPFSEEMYDEGYINIWNNDFSETAIS